MLDTLIGNFLFNKLVSLMF